jgi:hypothetical protein
MLCHPPFRCTSAPGKLLSKVLPRNAVTRNLNKQKHNHALQAARVALVLAGTVSAADARDARAAFSVGATVNAMARIELQSAPSEVLVTAADLRRGYLDVLEPTTLVIRSNSPAGFSLDVMTLTPMMSTVIVRGLESDQSLGADGGTIVQRWNQAQTVNLSLRFRFVLAPGLGEGRYPWPVRVGVRPLAIA